MRRTTVDGLAVVVKEPPYDATTEAAGLEALRAAGARVPRVLEATRTRLVLAEVTGDGDWAAAVEPGSHKMRDSTNDHRRVMPFPSRLCFVSGLRPLARYPATPHAVPRDPTDRVSHALEASRRKRGR